MSDDSRDKVDWTRRKTGLYLPKDIPDSKDRKIVGFARALEDEKSK